MNENQNDTQSPELREMTAQDAARHLEDISGMFAEVGLHLHANPGNPLLPASLSSEDDMPGGSSPDDESRARLIESWLP